MADRSISFDLLAIDKASDALGKVGREVAELGDRVSKASGDIQIDADTARASEKIGQLDSQLARLNAKSLKIDADTAQAERQVAVLEAELKRTTNEDRQVRINLDIETARAKLRALAAEKVSIDVDTEHVGSKLRVLEQDFAKVGESAVEGATEGSGAFSKLGSALGPVGSGLGMAAAALAALAAAAAAAELALAAVGFAMGAVAVAGAGMATVAAGFTGIGDAVTALGQKSTGAGQSMRQMADQIHAASEAVAAAHRDVRDAERDVVTAEREAERAHRDVAAAQKDLIGVEADAKRAEEDLTRARADAVRQLEDYRIRTEDMGLAQQDAALSVQEAQERLNQVNSDGTSTQLDRERAELSVAQAVQRQKDLSVEATRLQEDKTAADAKGVEGSDQVVGAQERVQQSQQRVQDATQRVADAQQRALDADQRVADAREKVVLATERLADAQHKLDEAKHPESAGGGANPLAEAMANLGPKAQEFAKFMKGFIDGPLKELRMAGQEAFLPGVERGLKAIEPAMKAAEPAFAAFSKTAGESIAGLLKAFAPMAKPFLEFANSALQGLAPLQPVLAQFAQQMGAMFTELTKSGVAKQMMEGLSQIIGALLPVLPPLIDAGVKVAAALGPSLALVVKSLTDAIIQMLPTLVQMAPQFAMILQEVAALIPFIVQMIPPLLQLGMMILQVTVASIGFSTIIMSTIVTAISSFIGWIGNLGSSAGTMKDTVIGGFQKVVDFVTGLPGKIGGALSKLFEPLATGFKSAINTVIRGWNSLHFSVPTVNIPGLGNVGGGTIGVRPINELMVGGIVTSPQLALVGEGGEPEAVVPLSKAGQMGFGGGTTLIVQLSGVLAGDEASFGRAILTAIQQGVRRGELPRTLLPTG